MVRRTQYKNTAFYIIEYEDKSCLITMAEYAIANTDNYEDARQTLDEIPHIAIMTTIICCITEKVLNQINKNSP